MLASRAFLVLTGTQTAPARHRPSSTRSTEAWLGEKIATGACRSRPAAAMARARRWLIAPASA